MKKIFHLCCLLICCTTLFAQEDYVQQVLPKKIPAQSILRNAFYYEHWGVLEKFSVNYERVIYDFNNKAHLALRLGGSGYERIEYYCQTFCVGAPQFSRKYDVTALVGSANILLGSKKHFFESSLLFRYGSFSGFTTTSNNSSEDVLYNIAGCSFAYRFQSMRPGVVIRIGINTSMYHYSKSPFGAYVSGGVVF